MENPPNKATLDFSGELIVGDHDSLTIFANEPQNKLRFTSKSIAEIAMRSTEDLESIINQILIEIDTVQVTPAQRKQSKLTLFRSGERIKVVRQYARMLKSINDMTLALQMQQATLIKENSLLKNIEPVLAECATSLEHHISIAEALLEDLNHGNCSATQLQAFSFDEMVAGQSRLERILEDIRLSHAISMQNIAQVRVMILNNQQIIDRIASSVTNSIPIWRTQVLISLHVEKIKSVLLSQDRIAATTSQSLKKAKNDTNIDWDKLSENNQALCNALKMLLSSEQKCATAKKAFSPNSI